MTVTVFDGEHWEWRAADSPAHVAGLSNLVNLVATNGGSYCYVVVPTDFYRYLAAVHPGRDLLDAALYLENCGSGAIFGYSISGQKFSLWRYSKLPQWVADY